MQHNEKEFSRNQNPGFEFYYFGKSPATVFRSIDIPARWASHKQLLQHIPGPFPCVVLKSALLTMSDKLLFCTCEL